jgi:exosortase E/protease (VPEID-CTERM system)
MPDSPARPAESVSSRPLPVVQWGYLACALVAEVLVFNLRFDMGRVSGVQGPWLGWAGHLHLIPRVAMSVATAIVLLGWGRWRDELRLRSEWVHAPSHRWPFFLLHLACFLGFFGMTALIQQRALRGPPAPAAWAAVRAALGVSALACWGLTALPARVWLALGRRGLWPLAAGALLGVVAWRARPLANLLWPVLSRSTFCAAQGLLALVFRDTVSDPAEFLVGTPSFAVQISPACSGYEGIGLIWMYLAVYLWLYKKDYRFPHALLLFPLGGALVWLANVGRIAALVAVGTLGSADVAVTGFHSQAGWLLFNGVALGLAVLTRRSRFFSTAVPAPVRERRFNPDAPYLLPLLALVGITMITGALSSDFDRLYPVRVLGVAGVLWAFRRQYAQLRWGWSWLAVGVGAAVFGLWLALEPAPRGATALPAWLAGLPAGWAAGWLCFRVVGSVAVVPLAEELAFRAYLPRRLVAVDFEEVPLDRFSWVPFLASSAAFGALHGRWLAGVVAGMCYALTLYRSKNLAAPVLAHATTNALIAAYVLATGTWSLWV